MTRLVSAFLLVCLCVTAGSFEQRKRHVLDAWAHPKGAAEPGYGTIAARLWMKEDAERCSRRLEQLLAAGPQGDMFWMYPVTAIAYLDRGQLTDSARKALRNAWRTYAPYRGDTENHWLLYYTCLYLMSQMYPGEGGDTWYTGKSLKKTSRKQNAGLNPGSG